MRTRGFRLDRNPWKQTRPKLSTSKSRPHMGPWCWRWERPSPQLTQMPEVCALPKLRIANCLDVCQRDGDEAFINYRPASVDFWKQMAPQASWRFRRFNSIRPNLKLGRLGVHLRNRLFQPLR